MLKDLVSPLDMEFAEEVYRTDSLFADYKKKSSIDEMRQYVSINQAQLKNTYTRLYELLDLHFPGLMEDYSADASVPQFGRQIARSMLDYIEFWLDEENEMTIRDRAMAANVEFLKNKAYPDEKIMLWAHNLHIRHHNKDINLDEYQRIKSMGSWLFEKYPEELYTVGFYMFRGQGAYNNGEIYDVESHAPYSLESVLNSTGYEASFTDLKYQRIGKGNSWMSTEIPVKAWGLQEMRLVPEDQYGAIVFIDSVSPPRYLKPGTAASEQ
jgi:erythromycin esterase-like protein